VPYNHEDVIRAQYEELQAEMARAHGEYESGRLCEDADSTMGAARRMIEIRQKLGALDNITTQYVASQQRQPAGNRYGLNQDQVDIAKSCGLTDEEYARNRDKLARMRQDGSYRDDNGRVTR
jgi:hypothetical protein